MLETFSKITVKRALITFVRHTSIWNTIKNQLVFWNEKKRCFENIFIMRYITQKIDFGKHLPNASLKITLSDSLEF